MSHSDRPVAPRGPHPALVRLTAPQQATMTAALKRTLMGVEPPSIPLPAGSGPHLVDHANHLIGIDKGALEAGQPAIWSTPDRHYPGPRFIAKAEAPPADDSAPAVCYETGWRHIRTDPPPVGQVVLLYWSYIYHGDKVQTEGWAFGWLTADGGIYDDTSGETHQVGGIVTHWQALTAPDWAERAECDFGGTP